MLGRIYNPHMTHLLKKGLKNAKSPTGDVQERGHHLATLYHSSIDTCLGAKLHRLRSETKPMIGTNGHTSVVQSSYG